MSAPPVKRACDACHRRKVRCTGGQPCRNCGQACLQCTYNAIPQKKGPKGSRAKVISELRDTQKQPKSSPPSSSKKSPSNGESFDFNSPPASPSLARDSSLLSPQTIDGCLTFFFLHLYPTMPIFDRQRLRQLVANQDEKSPEVHCLIGAMCAFMMVQPGMGLPGTPGAYPMDGQTSQSRYALANSFLEEVLRVRKTVDFIENPNLIAVQTSFFLFGSYFGLEKQTTAWFHLREASTLAQMSAMHEEPTYMVGDAVENIYKRRLYWLLLITERAYAMERHRPLTLHATIELPDPEEVAGENAVISGFLHMISLFRLFDDDFVGLWNKSRNDCSTIWLSQLQQDLSDALPPTLQSTDTQAVDIRITQQWLRTMVWQLSITNGYLSSSSPDSSMTFKYPVEIARDLLRDISSVPLQSMEVHGVGLIEKLFDVACTLTDVIACVPLDDTTLGDLPYEYLNQLLNLVSQLRGGASRFLPLLLAKVSENLPSMAAPIHHMPLSIKAEFNNGGGSLSPSMSAHSVPLMAHTPISPYAPKSSTVSEPGMMYSSFGQGGDGLTPTNTSTVVAPIPRSVPKLHFDGFMG